MGAGIKRDAIDEVRVSFVLEVFTAVRKLTLASVLKYELSFRGEGVRGVVCLCHVPLKNAIGSAGRDAHLVMTLCCPSFAFADNSLIKYIPILGGV